MKYAGLTDCTDYCGLNTRVIIEIRGIEQLRHEFFSRVGESGLGDDPPGKSRSALFDAEMESCLVLKAHWRVPVKAVQQFGHQTDEE